VGDYAFLMAGNSVCMEYSVPYDGNSWPAVKNQRVKTPCISPEEGVSLSSAQSHTPPSLLRSTGTLELKM